MGYVGLCWWPFHPRWPGKNTQMRQTISHSYTLVDTRWGSTLPNLSPVTRWGTMEGRERVWFIPKTNIGNKKTNKTSTDRQHTGSESGFDANDHSNLTFSNNGYVIDGMGVDKLSPSVIGKVLKAQIGAPKTVKQIQRGAIMVEAISRAQSEQLAKLTHLANTTVNCSPHGLTQGWVRSTCYHYAKPPSQKATSQK